MITIAIRFTSGGFHATPWGRHVNEGVPEWPPSPWRLLRALIASWKRTMPEVSESRMKKLIKSLSTEPSFWLPPATIGHTRHYMPWFKKSNDDKALVFDSFVVIPRHQAVLMMWEADMDQDDESLLNTLLGNLPYFGRSESWCQAYVGEPKSPNCVPLKSAMAEESFPRDCEPVRVLCPTRDVTIEELMVETTDLRARQKKIDPPGSVWITYSLPRNALDSLNPTFNHTTVKKVNVMRFALDSKPLPLLTATVHVGEVARCAVMAQYGRQNDNRVSKTLSGKDAYTKPLKGHKHAFYLPTDEDGDGRLDHLTVYSPVGFDEAEQMAIASVKVLNFGGHRTEVRTAFLGGATVEDISTSTDAIGPVAKSDVWESVTPVMLTRHPKVFRNGEPKLTVEGYQKDGAEDQILREWSQRKSSEPNLPDIMSIEKVDHLTLRTGRRVSWLDFKRWREFGSAPSPAGMGGGFRITFAREVHGPISFGYANHYGLGLLMPIIGS